jgi:hypothetical protein
MVEGVVEQDPGNGSERHTIRYGGGSEFAPNRRLGPASPEPS